MHASTGVERGLTSFLLVATVPFIFLLNFLDIV